MMNVSEFLKEFKKARKESAVATGAAPAAAEGRDDGAFIIPAAPREAMTRQTKLSHDHSADSQQGDDEGDDDDDSYADEPPPFALLGTKRQRYDTLWQRKEVRTGLRANDTEVRTYKTNLATPGDSSLALAARRRAVGFSSSRVIPRRIDASVVNALRDELLRKKKSLSHSEKIERPEECSSLDAPAGSSTGVSVEAFLLDVDDFLATEDLCTKTTPAVHEVGKSDPINSPKHSDPEPHTTTTPARITSESPCCAKKATNIASKSTKMSMFARAKLCSGGSGSLKTTEGEALETRKFPKQ
ncbi:hypothetical protein DQ04_01881030 [Trypanosoma grayi]|uniref:hypothetical protein n=1 Tax=Trypanosoma grayi TaxID=71804 RepID=UPI0004F41E0A|nr:hypothetical protein DQ04_01881030 [Trypanosoma grayi]KEG12219.1 hypothetical protein DQ04_01881030 [Trypanosoma grayi]